MVDAAPATEELPEEEPKPLVTELLEAEQADVVAGVPAEDADVEAEGDFGEPAAPEALPAAAAHVAPEVPAVPVLAAPITRARAEIYADVPGGKITYYSTKSFYSGTCSNVAHGRCVVSRSAEPGRRACQGRPLGFITAWLQQGETLATRAEHWNRTTWPSHAQRARAREDLTQWSGGAELLLFERPLRPDEATEPEECP